MVSNRESARRSRKRKAEQLGDMEGRLHEAQVRERTVEGKGWCSGSGRCGGSACACYGACPPARAASPGLPSSARAARRAAVHASQSVVLPCCPSVPAPG